MAIENDINSISFCGGRVRYIDLPAGRHYAASDVWLCLGYGPTLPQRRQARKAKGEFIKFGRLIMARRECLAEVFGLQIGTGLRTYVCEKIKNMP